MKFLWKSTKYDLNSKKKLEAGPLPAMVERGETERRPTPLGVLPSCWRRGGVHDMYFDGSWKEYAVPPSLAGLFTSALVNSIIFVLNFASSLKSQHSSQISVLVNALRLSGGGGGILEDGGG